MKILLCCTVALLGLSSPSYAQDEGSGTSRLRVVINPGILQLPEALVPAMNTTVVRPTRPSRDNSNPCAGAENAKNAQEVGRRINRDGNLEIRLANGWTRIKSLDKPNESGMRGPAPGATTCWPQHQLRTHIPSGFQIASVQAPYDLEYSIENAAYAVLLQIYERGGTESWQNCIAEEEQRNVVTALGRLHLRLYYLQWLTS